MGGQMDGQTDEGVETVIQIQQENSVLIELVVLLVTTVLLL